MLKYSISDQQKKITPRIKILLRRANFLISKIIKDEYFYDVNIVSSEKIKNINNKYRHNNKPTDVIAFAFHDANNIKTLLLGEIFINYQQARKQTNASYEYEILFLFVHGLLHLLGFNHSNVSNRKQMFDLQNKIVQQSFIVR
ncbi:MAG: rRNA maturation RNase YbeY [Mycoplasmataceae bacterium]|jgi:probable rRNA maturation factor|nr:rRNA maturation RNase YbeY [Mycoplasmataceae bacterium]